MSKPSKSISEKWTSNLAYAVGLLATDGNLSSDRRHISFDSKDKEQVENFIKCLGLTNNITRKSRSREEIKKYYQVQFGSVLFYKFLESIGLHSCKSRTIQGVNIPTKFFFDFLRGVFDGDGTFYVFKHPESQWPQLRIKFSSASPNFLRWLQGEINERLETRGYITKGTRAENLEYAKSDSLRLAESMYYSSKIVRLSRKYAKIDYYLRT